MACFVGIIVILVDNPQPVTKSSGKLRWLFPVAVSFHNLEEAIWLPGFWCAHGWNRVSGAQFRVAAVLVAALAFAVTYAAQRAGRATSARWILVAFCFVMLLNALWHIGATLYLRVYAPGVVTAVLLVLPVTAYLLLDWKRGRDASTPV